MIKSRHGRIIPDHPQPLPPSNKVGGGRLGVETSPSSVAWQRTPNNMHN